MHRAMARKAEVAGPFAPGLLSRIPQPSKVLLIRASRIGDFVCATPAFRALRNSLPHAEITLVGLPFIEELVERSPHLDRFVRFPGFPGMAEQFFEPRAAAEFFATMQAERFDLAVQMHGSGANSNPFTLLCGARTTAGFVRPGDSPGLLDAALPYPSAIHEVDRLVALSEFLGAPGDGNEMEFPISPMDQITADELIGAAARPLIGVHAGARDAIKRWRPERFAAVASALWRRWGGTIVFIGGDEDRDAVGVMMDRVPCLDLRRRTSLAVLGAVIRRLAVLVTNDSGPAHIAYALGAPTVTIFGGTSPSEWGPPCGPHRVVAHHVPCCPCELASCPIGYLCLEHVRTEMVLEAVDEVLLGASFGE
jgi:ADP-heptose:LPS heptosyltransferase